MDKIKKIQSFDGCIVDIIVTYDMGLQVDILTKNGFASSIGNLGQWPCYKIPMSETIKQIKHLLEESQSISKEEMLKNDFVKAFCVYHSLWSGDSDLDEEMTNDVLENLKPMILEIDCSQEYLYIYAQIERYLDIDIKCFYSYEDLEEYFLDMWAYDTTDIEDFDEETLDYYIEKIENKDFGIPLNQLEED